MISARNFFRGATRIRQPLPKSNRASTFKHSLKRAERRNYSSASEGESHGGGHGGEKFASDWPWAITSLVITIPSTYYLIQPQLKPKKSHDHDHHDGEHGEHEEHEEHEEKAEEESEESEPSHDEEVKSEDHEGVEDSDSGSSTGAADADSGDDGEEDKTPPGTSGLGNEEGRRKKSNQDGIRQGYAETKEQDPKDKDLAAAAKPAGNVGESNTQSAKQEGISNADTKHSTDTKATGQSQKGEGMPETAKSKGTVDPFRPQK